MHSPSPKMQSTAPPPPPPPPTLARYYSPRSLTTFYYMAESVSGLDKANPVFSLGTQADKMGYKKFSFWSYNKSFIDQACSVKMAGYWPRSFCNFIDLAFCLGL